MRSGRPLNIPEVGDVSPKATAQRMGITEERLVEVLPNLILRNFPGPDPDTGNFCIEAVDAWRRLRHLDLLGPTKSYPVTSQALDPAIIHAQLKAKRGRT